jgi:hypothetical protein
MYPVIVGGGTFTGTFAGLKPQASLVLSAALVEHRLGRLPPPNGLK